VFEQFNNPFAAQQAQQQTQRADPKKEEPHYPAPGWDGTTIWTPPANWQEPDLTDPRPWF
jgi:hypothetical protein